jgi:hypothetical protein
MFSRLGLLLRLNMMTRAVSLPEMFRILPEPTGTSSKQKLKSPANYYCSRAYWPTAVAHQTAGSALHRLKKESLRAFEKHGELILEQLKRRPDPNQ